MENLIELTRIVNQIKAQRIEVIGRSPKKRDEKVRKLYDGIAKGKFKTDEEAAKFVYGENYNKVNYASLKRHLKTKLINSLLFINLADTKYTDFQRDFYEFHKLRAVVKILSGKGAKSTSTEIAEKLLKKCLKYGFTEINYELAQVLRRHYRTFDKNLAKARKFNEIVTEQLEILVAENKVSNLYEELTLEINDRRGSQQLFTAKIKVATKEVRSIFPRLDSHKLGQFAHMIFVIEQELNRNYLGVEKACKDAILYYEKKGKFASNAHRLVFTIKLMAAYIPLKKFEEGNSLVTKILEEISQGSINWFVTMDFYFLLSMHTGNYEQAASILNRVRQEYSFKKLDSKYKEIWLIYDAYIEYLKLSGHLEKDAKNNFRVARFMNQLPIFSKDKKGINISILVIQILLLIAQGKETRVIDKLEALRTYVYTHLRNDESLRSNIFIKMLLKMVESNFHKNGTIRRTKALRKKLEESPIGTKGYSQYVEIIPYEKLWEMSLRFLSNRAF